MNNSTPHNSAKPGDFAETCIICGDPIRSKYIADNFIENAVLVNNVRGIQGYTGTYKGKQISVMAHGMGMPSLCIYVYELYNFYGVKNIIRLGTAGTISSSIDLGKIIIAEKATTPSNIVEVYGYNIGEEFVAEKEMVSIAQETAKELNLETVTGQIISTDIFYDKKKNLETYRDEGALAVEMEIAGLYMLAKECNKKAIGLLNVTDKPLEGKGLTSEERVTLMDNLITLVLNMAIKL